MIYYTDPRTVVKSVGPKLVPFFKTACIYFVLFHDGHQGSYVAAVFKCLPIVSLIVFVLLHGMNLSDEYAYSRRILFGLVFSCIGDLLLVFKPTYFLHGTVMFAIAQTMYTCAFGFRPPNFKLGGIVFAISGLIYMSFIWPYVSGILLLSITIYSCLINCMVWRALSRISFTDLVEDLWTWTKMSSVGGALLFIVSDVLLAIDMMFECVPHANVVIMVTYYAAQLGMAVSVVDSQAAKPLLEIRNAILNAKLD